MWDAESGELLWRYSGHEFSDYGAFQIALVSSRGLTKVVVANERGVVMLDGSSGMQSSSSLIKSDTVWGVSAGILSNGSSFIVGAGNDGQVFRWDADTGNRLGEPLHGHRVSVKAVDVVTGVDRDPIIVSGDETGIVCRWNADSGEMIGNSFFVGEGVARIGANCGRRSAGYFACADSSYVMRMWDVRTGKAVGRPISVGGYITGLVLFETEDALHIVASSEDSIVGRWNAMTGEYLGELASGISVTGKTLDSGETVIAVGTSEGSVLIRPV
jgi:WD40 repeat protein